MTSLHAHRVSGVLVAAVAGVGLLLGCLLALVVGSSPTFVARASVVMVPGPGVSADTQSVYFEVLSRGQATRTAAAVIAEPRWLARPSGTDATATGATLVAGAVPDTTLINVEVRAGSAGAAQADLQSVLDSSLPVAASSSGPFALNVVSGADQPATSENPGRLQMLIALGAAGLLVGAAAGFGVSRLRHGRRARRGTVAAPVTETTAETDAAVLRNGAHTRNQADTRDSSVGPGLTPITPTTATRPDAEAGRAGD
jgi:hypothetical protein